METARSIKGYEFREALGQGAFGAVYRAHQPQIGREVAIKVILSEHANRPDFIRRFEAEAHIVAQLEHPHIVPLYDYWREPDGAYLVMRLMPGGSLADLLAERHLELDETARIIEQIAAALSLAHRRGVVHRDLKPANILLDEDGNAYLSDFGIAKSFDTNEGMTATGAIIGSPGYLSPEQVRSEPVTPQADLYALGIVLYEMLTGGHPFADTPVGAMLLRHVTDPLPSLAETHPALDEVVQRLTAKDPAERFPDTAAFLAAFRRALSPAAPEPDAKDAFPQEMVNPYKGLRAFQEADAADFFGREALTKLLLARMDTEGDFQRFLAVVGPSGSGKSSVVRAGLLPALRDGAIPGSEEWFIVEMVPGAHPFEELGRKLEQVSASRRSGLAEELRREPAGLLQSARLCLPADNATLLIVIDQFEELFTLAQNPDDTALFLQRLHTAVTEPRTNVRLLITLRADFYDQPLMHPEFSQLVQNRTEVVVPLSAAELTRAILAPAARAGAGFEDGLATRIVADVLEQPGALPLLQYALTELFERREGRLLTLAGYEAIGGVLGALGSRAEEIYASLDEEDLSLARQVFLRLVTLGEGVEDTRRRVLQSELAGLEEEDAGASGASGEPGGASARLREVLDAFGGARLLTFDLDPATRNPTVEVAHEALLREWHRLRTWLDESRADVRMQRVLGNAAAEWLAADQDPSFLLRGTRLDQYAAWMAGADVALTGDEKGFLETSLAARLRREAEEAERQARLRELEQRAIRRLRTIVGVLVAASIVGSLLTLAVFRQSRIAQDNEALALENEAAAIAAQGEALEQAALAKAEADARARDAEVNRSIALAAQSQLALEADNVELALSLAWAAIQIEDAPPQAEFALADAAYAPGLAASFQAHEAAICKVAISPDGAYAASSDANGIIRLWDLRTWDLVRELTGHSSMVCSLSFSPDGRRLLSGSNTGEVFYWDLDANKTIIGMEGHTSRINDVEISPDGRTGISASSGRWATDPKESDYSIRVWDLETGLQTGVFQQFSGPVNDTSFSEDGRTLIVSTELDGILHVDPQNGKVLFRTGNADFHFTYNAHFLPGGAFAVIADYYELYLIDITTGERSLQSDTLIFTPFNDFIIQPAAMKGLTISDEVLIEWDLETYQPVREYPVSGTSISYTPDGGQVLIGSNDGMLKMLDLVQGAIVHRIRYPDTQLVCDLDYSSQGDWIVSSSCGARGLHFWRFPSPDRGEDGSPSLEFSLTNGIGTWPVAFLPGDRQVLAGLAFDLVMWDLEARTEVRRLPGGESTPGHNTGDVDTLAIHPNGRTVLSGAQLAEAGLVYWDIETGQPIWRALEASPDGPENWVFSVAISPDGSRALSSGDSDQVWLWDLATGEPLLQLVGHESLVWGVEFVDDHNAITGSDDRTLKLWDLDTGRLVRTFIGQSAGVRNISVSPDRRLVASTSRNGDVWIWDIASGQPIRRLVGHPPQARALAWHPSGREVLTGGGFSQSSSAGNFSELIQWRVDVSLSDLTTWVLENRWVRPLTCVEREAYGVAPLCANESDEFTLEPAPVFNTAIQPLLPALEVARPDLPVVEEPQWVDIPKGAVNPGLNPGVLGNGEAHIWEYTGTAGEAISVFAAADLPANHFSIAQQLSFGLLDIRVTIYSPSGDLMAENDDMEAGALSDALIESISLPEDGTYLVQVSSYGGQTGGGYRLEVGPPRFAMRRNVSEAFTSIVISPDGSTLWTGGGLRYSGIELDIQPNAVLGWNSRTGEVNTELVHEMARMFLDISADGRQLLSVGFDGQVVLWDIETGSIARELNSEPPIVLPLAARISPDQRWAAVPSFDQAVYIWDLETGELAQRLAGHEGPVFAIEFTPDSSRILSTSGDRTVRVWDVLTGEQVAAYSPFSDPLEQPSGLAVSPDGLRILVGGGRVIYGSYIPMSNILLMDLESGAVIAELSGHTHTPFSIRFSPDGRHAISGSFDGTVRLWDLETGENLAVFTAHKDWVLAVQFSPDGLTAYSASMDGTLRVWDLRPFLE